MFNFSLISQKNFLSFLKKVNSLFVNVFNNLKLSNLKRFTKLFFIDKRVMITLVIIFFSVFVHLSTPAFYKDSWVKEIVKSEFEKQFEFEIQFSDKLNYAIFPIPHFNFRDVRFVSDNKNLAKIETIKVYLTFSKFLDKNKMNIQNIIIKKANFDFYKNDLKNLLNFFNKKINDRKITISNSKIFLKNKEDDIYSIIAIQKSNSFYDDLELINKLVVSGEIFNNPFKFNLKNDFFKKKSNFELSLNRLNKKFINNINFENELKIGKLSYLDSRKKYDTNFEFDKNFLKFSSEEKVNDDFLYSGSVNFFPFSSDLKINLKSINLKKLLSNESFFVEILKSNIFANENLNFYISINSKNVLDHRRLKNLDLNINYENQSLNFNHSKVALDDILSIKLRDSKFINTRKKQYFIGEFEIDINNYSNLYTFFQTKKEFRKEMNSINLFIKYDFFSDDLSIEKLKIDGKSTESARGILEQFNQEENPIRNRIDLRNFFNSVIEEL